MGIVVAERVRTSGRWMVAGLVSLPALPFPEPTSRVIPDPLVPEPSRVCRKHSCRVEVGRSFAGQPALTEGYCPRCGTPFSFAPKLHDGDLVAGQYEVVGCLARGGLGWVYLARDHRLGGNFVVLKGLINSTDPEAVKLAESERDALIRMDHPNIVRIFNFVTHDDPRTGERTDYIVMEYLNGLSLRELQQAATRSGSQDRALPLEHVIGYGHEILSALEYLHDQGLLYCDMKPDNVIRCENRIKIIDLGGIRPLDNRHSPVVGTRGFQVERGEILTRGLSVRSDLYTVGKTLQSLFYASADASARTGAATRADSVSAGIESFQRLVRRATHKDWERRFASAAEMSEQLRGILREILSLRTHQEHPERSRVFEPAAALLDAGLGTVPPLEWWLRPGLDDVLADGMPPALSVAAGLPAPRVAPEDPAADLLAAVSAPEPRSLIYKLPASRTDSVEVQLRRCRAYLELADLDGTPVDDAVECLDAAAAILGGTARYDWRMAWHRGLLALAGDDISLATAEFDRVYAAIPGEVVPKIALGYCAERLDSPDQAERYYETVWQRDHTEASAAFGLARRRLARGDRAGAVEILDQVPRISRHYDAARVAAVRIYSGRLATGPPTAADLGAALRRLPLLHLDGGDQNGEARDRLTAVIHQARLDRVSHTVRQLPDGAGPDGPLTEREVREKLEHFIRRLARQARNADDHGRLVDLANAVRHRSRW